MRDREIENRYSKFMPLNYINIYFKDWKFNSNYVYEAFKKIFTFLLFKFAIQACDFFEVKHIYLLKYDICMKVYKSQVYNSVTFSQ